MFSRVPPPSWVGGGQAGGLACGHISSEKHRQLGDCLQEGKAKSNDLFEIYFFSQLVVKSIVSKLPEAGWVLVCSLLFSGFVV